MAISPDSRRTPNHSLAKQLIDCAMLVKEGEMSELVPEVMKGLNKYVKEKPKSTTKENKDKTVISSEGGIVRKKSKPSFHRNLKNARSNLLVFGWIQQQRRSKMMTVWKEVLASVVGSNRPGQQMTLWIQRWVTNDRGHTELEQLHYMPLTKMDEVSFLSKGSRFQVKEYGGGLELIFRCPNSPDAAQNWVMELQELRLSVTAAVGARGLNPEPTNRRQAVRMTGADPDLDLDIDDETESALPSLAPEPMIKTRAMPRTLKQVEKEPIHSMTRDSSRSRLKFSQGNSEDSVDHSNSSSADLSWSDEEDENDAFYDMVSSTPKRLSVSEEFPPDKLYDSDGENMDTLLSAMPLDDDDRADDPYRALKQAQKESDERKERLMNESFNTDTGEKLEKYKQEHMGPGDQIPGESTDNEYDDNVPEPVPLWSATSADYSFATEGSEGESQSGDDASFSDNRLDRQVYNDRDNQEEPPTEGESEPYEEVYNLVGDSAVANRPNYGTEEARDEEDWLQHQDGEKEEGKGYRGNQWDFEGDLRDQWAVSPSSDTLRPFIELITTVHTVLPPKIGDIEHSHFKRWTPVTREALGLTDDQHSRPNEKALKKVYKKMRKVFHPEGLPNDFDDAQREFCRCLWNMLSSAWDNLDQAAPLREWMDALQL